MIDVLKVWRGIVGETPRQVSSNLSGFVFPYLYNFGANTGAMKMAVENLPHDWTQFNCLYCLRIM